VLERIVEKQAFAPFPAPSFAVDLDTEIYAVACWSKGMHVVELVYFVFGRTT
jgi:hypothetical protein